MRSSTISRFLLLLTLCAASAALTFGCDDEEGGGVVTLEDTSDAADTEFDFSRPDADTINPDSCQGKTLCTIEGNRGCSSSPQGILECRRDSEGCLVQTLVEACTSGAICEDNASPSCGGACDAVPADRVCAAEGAMRCDGDNLQVCAPDARGCLAFSDGTDCTTQSSANACVSANGTAACGFDPCADADNCTEGQTCTGDSILTLCLPDAVGCLRETPYDCALVIPGSTCDIIATPDACAAPSGDPCEGVDPADRCDAAGTSCADGSLLTRCAPNPFGCLVHTETDCAALPPLPANVTGYCDASNAQNPRCAADSGDRCADLTLCDSALPAGNTCDASGAIMTTCAYDALGCFVQVSTTDCASADPLFVCNETTPGAATCGASCVDECVIGTAICANNRVTACAANGDSDPCGEWVEGEDCSATGMICGDTGASSVACGVTGGSTCDAPIRLSGSGSVSFDSNDFTNDYSGYRGTCRAFTNTVGGTAPDVVFSIDLAPGAILNAEVIDDSFDSILALANDCATLTADACLVMGDDPDRISYTNDTGSDLTVFLVVDGYSSGAGTFTLDFTSRVPACGDGVPEGAEACDDANTTSGDGCSADCSTVEDGYVCISPGQLCVERGAGDSCDQPLAISGSGTFLYNSSLGFSNTYGPYDGACGGRSGGGPDMVFSVFVDAGQVLDASILNETFDAVLALSTDCASINTSCVDYGDTPETVTYANTSGSGQTVFLIADGYSSGSGAFNLSVQTRTPGCGDGVREGAEVCDDANTQDGDGCAADCSAIEPGYVCGAPGQPCFMPAQGNSCTNPIPITADGNYDNNSTTGGFTNLYSGYAGTCRTFTNTIGSGANDVVYSIDLAPGEVLTAEVINDAFDSILALSDDCATLTGDACLVMGDDPDRITYTNTSGSAKPIFLIVDGYSTGAGSFTLSVNRRVPVCGDGITDGAEACDDTNTNGGDGCAADCSAIEPGYVCPTNGAACILVPPGNTCDDAMALGEGVELIDTSLGFTNAYTGYNTAACGGFTRSRTGADQVFAVTVPAGTELIATLDTDGNYNGTLVIASDCANILTSCQAIGGFTTNPQVARFDNLASATDTTVFVIADGEGAADQGEALLEIVFYTPICGSGSIDTGEVCDDGNTSDGDGCSADCSTIELGYTCPTAGSPCAPIVCGDGVREGAEVCDDGNAIDADGCSADCSTIEPGFFCPTSGPCQALLTDVESEPNGDCASPTSVAVPGSVLASIDPAGEYDFFTFTLDQPSSVMIETSGPAGLGSPCPGDTVIDLYNTLACTTSVTSNDDGGEGACSLITRDLAAGTYYVRVRGYSATATIANYSVNISATSIVCGNGVREGAEACDDGNTVNNDGCVADCSAIEPNYVCAAPGQPCAPVTPETEPNNTCAAPNAGSPFTLPATFSGLINAANDFDFYAIDLPAGANLHAEVTDAAGVDCPADLYLEIYNVPACTTPSASNDDAGLGLCPLLDSATSTSVSNLPAGTYYVKVRAYSTTTVTTAPYILSLYLNP
jgi:cysteine-rich repeat protein